MSVDSVHSMFTYKVYGMGSLGVRPLPKTLACIWTDRWIVIWTDLSAVGALRQSGLA